MNPIQRLGLIILFPIMLIGSPLIILFFGLRWIWQGGECKDPLATVLEWYFKKLDKASR